MATDSGCRKQVLDGEMGTDRAENFWQYSNGDIGRVHGISPICGHAVGSLLVNSSLDVE